MSLTQRGSPSNKSNGEVYTKIYIVTAGVTGATTSVPRYLGWLCVGGHRGHRGHRGQARERCPENTTWTARLHFDTTRTHALQHLAPVRKQPKATHLEMMSMVSRCVAVGGRVEEAGGGLVRCGRAPGTPDKARDCHFVCGQFPRRDWPSLTAPRNHPARYARTLCNVLGRTGASPLSLVDSRLWSVYDALRLES